MLLCLRHYDGGEENTLTAALENSRRVFLKGTTGAAASLLCTPWAVRGWASGTPTPAEEWPQFRGNARLTGVTASSPPALELLWTHEAGEEGIESSAAIVDGTVYVGTVSGHLLSVDLGTGERRWAHATESEIGESSPCVSGGLAYVGDLDGVVHAVKIDDGTIAWTYETDSEIRASPVIHGDRLLVGSYDQQLYALDAKTGARLWSFETEGPVHATSAVADGLTYVAGCDGALRALRIDDGTQAFTISSGGYTGASPALQGTRAFYGTFENEVLGVDLEAQAIAWRYEHEDRHFPFYSSAALAEGRMVLGGRDRMVHALDIETGRAHWTFMTRARIDSSPAIAGGRVFVGSGDGRLYVLDLETGDLVEDFDSASAFVASPAIASGRLVIGTVDGQLFCFGRRS
jgi:outer membrane protein assembly factor BamB